MNMSSPDTPALGTPRSPFGSLPLILLIAASGGVFSTSILHGWHTAPARYDDADYADIAREVVGHGELRTHHFPVGYPLFLASILGASGGSFAAVRVLQLVLALLTLGVVRKIAHLLYDQCADIQEGFLSLGCALFSWKQLTRGFVRRSYGGCCGRRSQVFAENCGCATR